MAQLPPKIPNMNPHWPDYFSGHHQKLPLQPFVAAAPAMNAAPSTPVQSSSSSNNNNNNNNNEGNNNPSWVDEFLDFSHARRGAHRRSASDSIAFLDSASLLGDACRLNVGAGDNVASAGPGSNADSGSDFERFDDEHLMSMFTDEISPKPVNIDNNNGATAGTAISSLNPSMPCDRNSINEEKPQLLDRRRTDHQIMKMKMKDEVEEVHSPCDSETGNASTATVNATGPSDRIVDPKRVKRILANRQSAQRSRVRKLQYIAELERSVTSLQAEVAVLSPRVAFLDHQRLLLNVDNSTLKQRIAALAQDKIFKDAHQEALKREIERLRQVYHQQSLNNMENKNATPTSSLPPAPASDVPTAIPIREQQLAS